VDGCDLALGKRVVRFAWSAPVKDAREMAREMVRMAKKGPDGGQ